MSDRGPQRTTPRAVSDSHDHEFLSNRMRLVANYN